MLELGFNVFIVPEGVEPDQVYQAGLAGHDMLEQYAQRLSEAELLTVNHVLPSLSAPLFWPEEKTSIVLTGIRGEIALAGRKRGVPLIQTVEPGQIALGYEVANRVEAEVGDELTLLDQQFEVIRIHNARGNQDDNTAGIHLATAQGLLDKPGRITGLQAINCLAPQCYPDETGIPAVNEEISKILPGTRTLVDMGKARTRIDARKRAAAEAQAALDQEVARRSQIREQIDQFASILVGKASRCSLRRRLGTTQE